MTTTVPAEWSTGTATAFVAALDSTARGYLLDALETHAFDRLEADLIAEIRSSLGACAAKVAAVVFEPRHYDNGYYFTAHAALFFRDGRRERRDLYDTVGELLTQRYGCTHSNAWAGVDLTGAGTTEIEDNPFSMGGWLAVRGVALPGQEG